MLEIAGLTAGYGPVTVLREITLHVPAGSLTAIIGPNGAGKTTLLCALAGLLPHAGGLRLDGAALGGSAWERAERGLVLVPEGRMLFGDMSVEENLHLGAYPKRCRSGLGRNLERVYGLFPRLKERRGQAAGALSGGEAQMLALGRGLMAEPRLLLIDEPALGLAPVVVREVFAAIRGLKAAGTTIVLVEQNTGLALAVADTVHLLRGGRLRFGAPAAAVDLARLHDLYFAREEPGPCAF